MDGLRKESAGACLIAPLGFGHVLDQEALDIADAEFMGDVEGRRIVDAAHHHLDSAVERLTHEVAVRGLEVLEIALPVNFGDVGPDQAEIERAHGVGEDLIDRNFAAARGDEIARA